MAWFQKLEHRQHLVVCLPEIFEKDAQRKSFSPDFGQ